MLGWRRERQLDSHLTEGRLQRSEDLFGVSMDVHYSMAISQVCPSDHVHSGSEDIVFLLGFAA
jgi:hypothetical protein